MLKHVHMGAVVLVFIGIIIMVFLKVDSWTEPPPQAVAPSETVMQEFANVGLGLAFTYPGGSEGYTLIEPDTPAREASLLKTIMLVRNEDMGMVEELLAAPESSPVITITIFINSNHRSLVAWATEHQTASHIDMALSSPEEIMVAGTTALQYRTEGFQARVVLVSNRDFVYVVRGGFRDETSPIFSDFDTILNSFTFPGN